jgi:hypothetical protein
MLDSTGDAEGYSLHFALNGTVTNILGAFSKDIRLFATDIRKSSTEYIAGPCWSKNFFESDSFTLMSRLSKRLGR